MTRQNEILAIGNAIVDVIARTDDAFLAAHGMNKGGMQLLESSQEQARLYDAIGHAVEISGGSAANTAAGIASCGGSAGFIGKIGRDKLGEIFTHDIRAAGVAFTPVYDDGGAPTASSIVLVSDDAERTMNTHLGASANLAPQEIDREKIAAAGWVYLEGYMFDMPQGPECFALVADEIHDGKLAFSLSDAWCVTRHHEKIMGVLAQGTDLLFGNKQEMEALTGKSGDAVFGAVSGLAREVVITMGGDGAVVIRGGARDTIPAEKNVKPVDTTGAGDLFAAGYLHARARGGDAVEAGRCGAIAAAEIIGHMGARPETSLAKLIASAK